MSIIIINVKYIQNNVYLSKIYEKWAEFIVQLAKKEQNIDFSNRMLVEITDQSINM